MLQKELPKGLMDEECGRDVKEEHAGLCVYVRGGGGGETGIGMFLIGDIVN